MKKILNLPEKVGVDGIDNRLIEFWDDNKIYQYNNSDSEKEIFSIDTPPPTVSGSLHVGHVFSYTHTDLLARYKRMQGFNVFYPMGFDDNGLPTERRVQNYFGVRPDLSVPYIENFKPPFEGTTKNLKASEQMPISRQNFVELCEKLSLEDEKVFKDLWVKLGISVDWDQTYQTIGEKARRIAQKAFLRNLKRGEAYQMEAPGLWDITFQTAVAQAELEAREYPGFYHKLSFWFNDNGVKKPVHIETTRPELLISCVALIAHPDDERYQNLFGKTVSSPLFGVEVPVLAHKSAQMDKGAGIAMCCTFGDQTDIDWWRDLNLPLRSVIERNGRLRTVNKTTNNVVDWIIDESGKNLAVELDGKTTYTARQIMVEKLLESKDLVEDPKPTTRMTNFFEKGDKPLEIVTSRQWYIKNGGKCDALNQELTKRGDELGFFPDFMRVRYHNWVNGLNNDWLISRQRFFGVAFPIWYKLDQDGNVLYDEILTPEETSLPIDPVTDVPDGYSEDQRDKPNGFTALKDVMDTWATSSLTPQIATGWEEENGVTTKDDFAKLFPMSIRPQGQDIIRTWLFSTVVRSHLEHNSLPWQSATISGWILDPDRKKMSKSKGNVITPVSYIEQYGPDAVRYWAALAKLGTDATFEEGIMKIGRRLAMKVLNATKFTLSIVQNSSNDGVLPMNIDDLNNAADISFIGILNETITTSTNAFDKYEHSVALSNVERTFWTFCDDYLELVKTRAYSGDLSAKTTLCITIDSLLRLLAPFIPFACDKAWSWFNENSVHSEMWVSPLQIDSLKNGKMANFDTISNVLIELRRIKSEAKVSPKTPLNNVVIITSEDIVNVIKSIEEDLVNSLNIMGAISYQVNDQDDIKVSGQIVSE